MSGEGRVRASEKHAVLATTVVCSIAYIDRPQISVASSEEGLGCGSD